jgi:hypothetical protein
VVAIEDALGLSSGNVTYPVAPAPPPGNPCLSHAKDAETDLPVITLAVSDRRLGACGARVHLEPAQVLRCRRGRRAAEKLGKGLDGADVVALGGGPSLRTVISSVMRCRSGLMGVSLIGGPLS